MSGSGWVITSMWISGSLPFLYSSMYSYHFLIYSASVKSTLFLSFIVPIIVWHVPLVSLIFSKRSLVLPIPLFSLFICIVCSRRFSYLSLLFFGTLHSDGFSPLPFTSLLFSGICKASSDNPFAFLPLGIILITASYTMFQTSIHSSLDTLSNRSNPLNLFVTSTI